MRLGQSWSRVMESRLFNKKPRGNGLTKPSKIRVDWHKTPATRTMAVQGTGKKRIVPLVTDKREYESTSIAVPQGTRLIPADRMAEQTVCLQCRMIQRDIPYVPNVAADGSIFCQTHRTTAYLDKAEGYNH